MNIVFETARKITKNKTFNVFIFVLILLSAIIIGIETYSEIASRNRSILTLLDKVNYFMLCCGNWLENCFQWKKAMELFFRPLECI